MACAVNFENVSKRYQIGSGRRSLGEVVSGLPARLLQRNASKFNSANEFWALRDVSFTLQPGQVLGLIGRNGAGKTTTLKLLSGIVQPTTGRVAIAGRVSALIELGAGFHPDLTGRENVFLNGVILGLSRREIARKFESIVAFAELERFIDTPVKRYSSGMYARLGFAVAAHVDPDVLLVDEVLAVGDLGFQKKCHEFIQRFVSSGKTAIFVTHNMFVVEQVCSELIWLKDGSVAMTGPSSDVLPKYLDWTDACTLVDGDSQGASERAGFTILEVNFTDRDGNLRDTFRTGEDIVVQLKYQADSAIRRPHFCLGVSPQGGSPLFLASMLVDGQCPDAITGVGVLRCRFKHTPLMPKVYEIWGEVWGSDRLERIITWRQLGKFRIADPAVVRNGTIGKGGLRHLRTDAAVQVPYEWDF